MKLAVITALEVSAERRAKLASLSTNPGLPRELMLSKRSTPGASPRSAASPREFTAGARRSPRNTQL